MPSISVATKTVLIAGADAAVRDRFRVAIEQSGHTVVVASTATQLLTKLRGPSGVDLLVLDLRVPPAAAAGVGLVRAIRAIDSARPPVLLFSGSIAGANEVRDLAGLGVAGYINEFSPAPQIVPSIAPHLFPDSFNRRSSPRVVLGIPVQYRFSNTIAAALTLNLSRGGIAIRTTSPLETGARLKVRFRMPGSQHDVDADGRVAWHDRRVGMGIQFEAVDPAQQALIDHFVDAHFDTNRK